ncbi:MAG: hypothetical protein Q8876_08885 [Bacillota bacterium]|nr:hypothetical protein [Bacillota bacterium]
MKKVIIGSAMLLGGIIGFSSILLACVYLNHGGSTDSPLSYVGRWGLSFSYSFFVILIIFGLFVGVYGAFKEILDPILKQKQDQVLSKENDNEPKDN